MSKRAKQSGYAVDCSDKEEMKKWQAQSDLRTLRDAMDIYKDKARLKAAKAEADKAKEALEDIVFDKE